MWPRISRRRTLLMVALLPLVCVASMPLGNCICSSGGTVVVVGSRCVGCDCSCSRQHACCPFSTRERSRSEGACRCQRGCHRSVIAPAFTSAECFKWTQSESSVWIDCVLPRSVRPNAVGVTVLARHTILPISHLYLENNVLRL